MNLTKLRFFLILALVTVNILFAKMYFDSVESKNNISADTISDTVSIFRSYGIEIAPDVIEVSKRDKPIFVYNPNLFKFVSEDNDKKTFLNNDSLILYFNSISKGKGNVKLSCFSIPGGNSLNIETSSGTLAYASFTNNNSFIYNEGIGTDIISDTILNKPLKNEKIKISTKNAVNKFLKAFSGQRELYYEIVGTEKYDGGYIVRLNQKYNGLKLRDAELTIFEKNGVVRSAFGNWYFGEFKNIYSENQIDGVNILFSEELLKSKKIAKEELVYCPFVHDESKMYFVPCWTVTCEIDDGNTGEFTYDAVNGNLYNSQIDNTE